MPDDRSSAAPVFVDPTGRRRRTVRTTAVLGAFALFGVGVVIVAALLGAPIGPPASFPEPAQPVPPAVAEQPLAPGPGGTATGPKPTGTRRPAPAPATTTTTSSSPAGTTSTTTTHGKPGHTPPGRPTNLPTPPGHTR